MSGAGLLAGRRGLVMGVANDRSIAWGVAKAAAEQGAELAFTFQGEALEKRVRPGSRRNGAAWTSWFTPSPTPIRTN